MTALLLGPTLWWRVPTLVEGMLARCGRQLERLWMKILMWDFHVYKTWLVFVKRRVFKKHGLTDCEYVVSVSNLMVQVLSDSMQLSSFATIKPIKFDDLFAYDTDVFGAPHQKY